MNRSEMTNKTCEKIQRVIVQQCISPLTVSTTVLIRQLNVYSLLLAANLVSFQQLSEQILKRHKGRIVNPKDC